MKDKVNFDSVSEARRGFIKQSGMLIAAAAMMQPFGLLAATAQAKPEKKAEDGKEISPAEDLMREHGILSRLLLIYEEVIARLNSGREFPVEVLVDAAGLIRRFVEDYHEKLEENYLFPRFKKAGKLVDLVKVLLQQHQAGRRLTDRIRGLATASAIKNPAKKRRLARYMSLFIRMYRPHKAREDTALFPAFRSIVSPKEYASLGEAFEDQEEKLFGKGGFEHVVSEVERLEKAMGMYELSQFTASI
ncbi:MAG: hemerythrin [Deltaproteobacteria bacterium RBG_16_54_11]|nr:MAG: hemerythrin [Deltaproteobacteria bacterium RBG_16_54_11]